MIRNIEAPKVSELLETSLTVHTWFAISVIRSFSSFGPAINGDDQFEVDLFLD